MRHQVAFFWVFGMTWPGIEPWSPRPLTSTQPLCQWAYKTLIQRINLSKGCQLTQIGIKSWVKDYTIQFSIKSNIDKMFFFSCRCHLKWLIWVRYFIVIRRFLLFPECNVDHLFQTGNFFSLYQDDNPTF